MNPRFSRTVAVFLSIVVFLSTFAANPLSKSLTFLEVRYVAGTGIVLLFESTGLNKSDLRGATITVHSNSYNLSCNFKDAEKKDETKVVRCVASGGLSQWAGESFTAYVAGYSFSGIVPAEKSSTASCLDGEELWLYVLITLEPGEQVGGPIPADIFYEFLAPLLQDEGLDYEIVDQACFPIEEGPFPEPQ
jgi:hypothetical protein